MGFVFTVMAADSSAGVGISLVHQVQASALLEVGVVLLDRVVASGAFELL